MYAREINGQEYDFGVSGKLIRNVLVMYDRQTESYWSQLLGEAVEGELKGTKLEFLPSLFTTWEQWQDLHPETLALEKINYRGGDIYTGYYASPDAGVIGETLQDDRLFTKEFVIGVEAGDDTVAYPYSVLNDEPVINDVVDGDNLLVVFDVEGATGVVFDREVAGQTLTFDLTDETTMLLTDAETGTTWDGLSGAAIDGPLAGENLEPFKSVTSFWFGWKDFHPDTVLYGIDS